MRKNQKITMQKQLHSEIKFSNILNQIEITLKKKTKPQTKKATEKDEAIPQF